jgi:hypothetical protein
MSSGKQPDATLSCSFCGKSEGRVKKLIAGPSVRICDECVKICNDILADSEAAARAAGPEAGAREETFEEFHIGTFTCPKCRGTFALHSRWPLSPEE